MDLEKITTEDLKDELENRGLLVFNSEKEAMNYLDDDAMAEYLQDTLGWVMMSPDDIIEEDMTDEVMLRRLQEYVEKNPETAKKWLCDIFRLMHTVEKKVILQKVDEALTKK